MNITQMREFLSHLSDDTLQHVEAAASRDSATFGVTSEQRDQAYSVMYAIRRVYDDRDAAERAERAEQYW